MADLPGLRAEIAARTAAEEAAQQAPDCRFHGHVERCNNIIDSANAVNGEMPGTYTTVERIHPSMSRVVKA